jgi:predicted GNAT family N-acyltransferase
MNPEAGGAGVLRVKQAETPAEWIGAVAVRLAVFVAEQGVPLRSEMDEHDRTAVHAVAVLDPAEARAQAPLLLPARAGVAARATAQAGKYLPLSLVGARGGPKDVAGIAPVVGTGRLLRATGGLARIGRLAALPAWRGRGIGSRLLRLLEEAALARGADRVEVHAQVSAQAFYTHHGYVVVSPGTTFVEDGILHVRMAKPLSTDME